MQGGSSMSLLRTAHPTPSSSSIMIPCTMAPSIGRPRRSALTSRMLLGSSTRLGDRAGLCLAMGLTWLMPLFLVLMRYWWLVRSTAFVGVWRVLTTE